MYVYTCGHYLQALSAVLKMLDRLCTADSGGFLVKRKAAARGGGRRKAATAQVCCSSFTLDNYMVLHAAIGTGSHE